MLSSCLTSCVQCVENNIKIHHMQIGYSVTDVRDSGIKLVQFTNQVSLYVTTVLPQALQTIVTSLVRILTRPIGQECAFQIF